METITTNPEMVHAIAEVTGGAIELPKVTSEDAGDILAVDESGKWAKTEPGSGDLLVNLFFNPGTGKYSLPSSIDFSALAGAVNDGKNVILTGIDASNYRYYWHLYTTNGTEGIPSTIQFFTLKSFSTIGSISILAITSAGITESTKNLS